MLSPNGITTILFDLDGTLRRHEPLWQTAFLDYAVAHGAPDSETYRRESARWNHYYWAQSPELVADIQAFPDDEAFWINYACRNLASFGCPPQLCQLLAPDVTAHMASDGLLADIVPEDVLPTLQRLRAVGFKLGVVTNRRSTCRPYLEQLGLAEYMDFDLAAGEVNLWKPDPAIFAHAVERLGIQPEQSIYVGDNYYADILGARQAGLHPVLIDPDNLFPEADCPTITTIGDLCSLVVW